MSRARGVAIFLTLLLAGCAGITHGGASEVISVEGAGTGAWGSPSMAPNFQWKYETVAGAGSSSSPYHRMKSELELAYDPVSGEIRAARLTSSGRARTTRTITVTPVGSLLKIRVLTLLDPNSEDRTVLKIGAPSGMGVGPVSGLVEAIQVKFAADGSFQVSPDTGAHLAGANVRVDRRMTCGPEAAEPVTASFP